MAARRGPGPTSPGAPQPVTRDGNHPNGTAATLIAELIERATVGSYYEHGPVAAALIEQVAHALRYEAVDLLARGYELQSTAALVLAERLDETAELARLLRSREVA